MIRAIGFMQGLRGDLVMSTVCARSFKEQYPDAHLTLGVHKRFKDLLPLFHDSQFDSTHVWETYDGWPGPRDLEYIQSAKHDIVFHAMPQHRDEWWKIRHQYAETAYMCGLPIPTDIRPKLARWFGLNTSFHNRVVAFAPFGGNNEVNDKMLSVEQAQGIVDYLTDRGWSVLHLGASTEPALEGAIFYDTSYFDSVRNMLSCRALIHCDTGMGHVAGAYNHPSLGIYGWRYHGEAGLKHIQPLHGNFLAVNGPKVCEISLDTIAQSIDTLLA
jgi:ADP-heptose:LPS heptosyltransferase